MMLNLWSATMILMILARVLYTVCGGDYSRAMSSQFDESDFIDRDYQSGQASYPQGVMKRPPTREELDARVAQAQQKLTELRQAQEKLERERAALEEARRRRVEFQTGREEMLQHLTRGLARLQEAEFVARRDAEHMARTLADLREHLDKIQAIQEENWTQENLSVELTKALAAIENARMEWNGARLKWALLDNASSEPSRQPASAGLQAMLDERSFMQMCKLGLALTWPVALLGIIGLIVALFLRLN
jgi:hypothetical protein